MLPLSISIDPNLPKVEVGKTRIVKSIDTIPMPDIKGPRKKRWHPPHKIKSWVTSYKNCKFRVVQLPRCEHVEAVFTYNPSGETLKQAKLRTGGIASCSGSFHNPQSMALADFFQKNGSVFTGARTGRGFFAVSDNGKMEISRNYSRVKGKSGVSALALGQFLIPLQQDGFPLAFMNRNTDRMAIGLNANFIFVVQGQSDIWTLAAFMRNRLPVTVALNSDGGHVVRGKAPVHIVFRWKKSKPILVAKKVINNKEKAQFFTNRTPIGALKQ